MERTLNIYCEECTCSYTIITEEVDNPDHCPFCASVVELNGKDTDDYSDWDWEDE